MSDTNALAAPTAEEIEIAIDETVSALVAYRLHPPEQAQRALDLRPKMATFPIITAAQIMDTSTEVHRARDLAASPVEVGLKHSLRQLGKLLHALVGDEEMRTVAERVCAADAANYSRRASPIDSAWNGIGHWVS